MCSTGSRKAGRAIKPVSTPFLDRITRLITPSARAGGSCPGHAGSAQGQRRPGEAAAADKAGIQRRRQPRAAAAGVQAEGEDWVWSSVRGEQIDVIKFSMEPGRRPFYLMSFAVSSRSTNRCTRRKLDG
jgi:hypothetical protein